MSSSFFTKENEDVYLYLTEELPLPIADAIIGLLHTNVDSSRPCHKYIIEFFGSNLLQENPLLSLRVESEPLTKDDMKRDSFALSKFKDELHSAIIGILQ